MATTSSEKNTWLRKAYVSQYISFEKLKDDNSLLSFYTDLSFRFGFSESTVTRIYRTWLPIIAENVKFLIVWPEKHVLRRNLPTSFRKKFYNCVAIIDCMEIFIERPFSLHARTQTWSNYKNNTIKYLIGITPSGAVGILKLPKFTKGKKQMSSAEVDESRQIAHVRIHVERVIGRLRKFRILQSIIPITQVDLLNNVMVMITSLVNINSSVVPPSS
ncbi:uncharacterized protein LOC136079930 [Hydra vulgaris]|uniref:Uncharacterized protein LOC136079930 n=1 Tax=Hydra vulgaris TaxID=6087 RepID=A0ABM4BU31_HYDVU